MNILETIYLELADTEIENSPFQSAKGLRSEKNIVDNFLDPLMRKDKKSGFAFEDAFYSALYDAQKDGFFVGFRAAVSLICNGGEFNFGNRDGVPMSGDTVKGAAAV